MTDEVRLLSLKKQQAWLSWKKNTDNHQAREEYTKLKKQTCRAVEKAKNAWWEEQVKEIEAKYEMAVKSGRGGSLLKALKHLRLDQKSKSSSALKTADGQGRLVKTQDKLERWRQHFSTVLNVQSVVSEVTLGNVKEYVEVNSSPEGICDLNDDELSCPPTEEEIAKAINQLKNNKATGADEITAELLKLGGGVMVQWLTQLSQLVWLREEVPVDWRTQLTIPLHKKGSYDGCDNFRGIALLSVPGKVFCRFLQNRMKEKVNRMLRENQCGFRQGLGCADQLFSLRMLMERAREFH